MHLRDAITLKSGEKTYLRIKVVTRQNKTEFFGMLDDGTLKIRLKAVPEKGKANKELVGFLSEELSIDSSRIEIIAGASDTTKLVRIS